MIIRWPGHVPAGRVENGIVSGLDWFPTFVAAAGDPSIVRELKKGKQLGGTDHQNPRADGCRRCEPLGARVSHKPRRDRTPTWSTASNDAWGRPHE
jgi:arylsulfatase A-like enzyme